MKFGTSGVRGLVEELLGGGAYIYATGFARHMLNRGDLSVGDEVNGRPFKPLPTRDSFIPILAALNFMARRPVKLSQIAAQFDFFAAKADRLENFPTEASDALMRHLRSSDDAISNFLAPLGSSVGKSDVDGLRITLAGGDIIHFRPSGNAPETRGYVESKTDTGADTLLSGGLDIIRSWAERRTRHSQM